MLDESIEESYREEIREELAPFAEVVDLHMWRVSGHHYAAAITLVSQDTLSLQAFKQKLSKFDKISHLTLEVRST
ncbi:putative transporter [Vibrio maritimus]|uniref:Putative transporter n=1 Tax=Vibrio maritimus TaxID=990268 RepID=A0A090S480_9VIBR|nr:putative transporter [Vibrio maritimus]